MQSYEDEMKKRNAEHQRKVEESNKYLDAPDNLEEELKPLWDEIANLIKESTSYIKKPADRELIREYVMTKRLRDLSYNNYMANPERFQKKVTEIGTAGRSSKIKHEDNGDYVTWNECDLKLERILKIFKVTPDTRNK